MDCICVYPGLMYACKRTSNLTRKCIGNALHKGLFFFFTKRQIALRMVSISNLTPPSNKFEMNVDLNEFQPDAIKTIYYAYHPYSS